MATQYIKFKRSSIPGKRPSNSQMELGELALNTNDGRIFTKKENVGVGTTITLLNVWTENVGGGAYYTDGNIGIGTTNAVNNLQVFGGITAGNATSSTLQSGYSILRPNDSTPRTFAIVEDDTNLRIGGGAWNAVNIRTAPNNEVIVAITSSGNVGIGTTNPTKRLHILDTDCDIKIGDVTEGTPTTDGGIIFSGLGTFTSGIFTEVDGEILSYGINVGQITGIETGRVGGIFRLDTRNPGGTGDSNCFVVKGRSIGTTIAHNSIIINLNDGNTFLSPSKGVVVVGTSITTGTPSQNLQVSGGAYVSGNIGIGTTNPTSKLTVQGDVLVSGVITSTDYNSASDINLKENIQPIENPIDKVLQITGVSFDWKDDSRSSMGVIAQEVERVLPELVSGADSKTVNYNGLIGLLIEVVKEQQREINTLKEKIK